MVAAFVSESIAPRTAFEDIAVRGMFPWKDGHPELRIRQLRDRDEPGGDHRDGDRLAAVFASASECFAVRPDVDGLVGAAALDSFRR